MLLSYQWKIKCLEYGTPSLLQSAYLWAASLDLWSNLAEMSDTQIVTACYSLMDDKYPLVIKEANQFSTNFVPKVKIILQSGTPNLTLK